VRGAQDHTGGLVCFECFLPSGRTQTPAIAGLKARKQVPARGSKDRCRAILKNRETRLSSRRRPCDCQHLLARYCSSRPDESRSWAASSRFRAARQARYVRSTGDQLHYPSCPATLSFPAPQAFKALRKLHLASEGRPRREMIVVLALTKSRNWNTQYTGGPLSTLRRSLPLCLLRFSLFGHVIAPDVIEPSPEYNQQTKGAI
jgi:hypothetical protein